MPSPDKISKTLFGRPSDGPRTPSAAKTIAKMATLLVASSGLMLAGCTPYDYPYPGVGRYHAHYQRPHYAYGAYQPTPMPQPYYQPDLAPEQPAPAPAPASDTQNQSPDTSGPSAGEVLLGLAGVAAVCYALNCLNAGSSSSSSSSTQTSQPDDYEFRPTSTPEPSSSGSAWDNVPPISPFYGVGPAP